MTNPGIDMAAQDWITVETLICRLELARRAEAPADPEREMGGGSEARCGPTFESIDALRTALDLTEADATILIFALAPTARPKLGWLYREFQPGETTGLPGIDLICELLQLTPSVTMAYRNRLVGNAPLMKQGLLLCERQRPYAPLRPTARALRLLLGLGQDGTEVPGAILVPSEGSLSDDGGSEATKRPTLLEQLVGPAHLVRQLERIARWPQHDRQLARWNVPVEHGPVILFSGPSGTGKTMAARAMAERAGLPLYRVDMGMLVSKYIGDTPKNINRLFDQATRDDAILIFDEAEGLFGKRGKVEDARDRYANMEVGHLLSRIERYPGICLLTTNLREHIDRAFLRRIDVVLHFNAPSNDERVRLWRRYLGDMIGPKDKLPSELAEDPKLSGAQIASACRFAARCLAEERFDKQGRPGRAALLQAIAEGVWSEFRKSGSGAIRSSLGSLEAHLAGV